MEEILAEVYALDKPVGTSFGDVEYYRDRLQRIAGKILEPGVGTGRLLIPLLQAGLDVDGIDTSKQMLAICRHNCQTRGLQPVLLQADMIEFSAAGAYDAVIIPAGSFGLITGQDKARQALCAMYDCLAPQGRFIVDLEPPELNPAVGPLRYWRNGNELLTMQTLHVEVEPSAQTTTRYTRYDKWRDGALVDTAMHIFCISWYGVHEFTTMLHDTGFTSITTSADYRFGSPIERTSQTWTYEAQRL